MPLYMTGVPLPGIRARGSSHTAHHIAVPVARAERNTAASEIAYGTPVELLTFAIRKEKAARLGVTLSSLNGKLPEIYSMNADQTSMQAASSQLRPGDIIAEINGKKCQGASSTAKKIFRASQTRLTVWRPITNRIHAGA